MKLLIATFLLLPTLAFAQSPHNSKNSAQKNKALSMTPNAVCGRQSDWSCLGHTVSAMCTVNPQQGIYGHCDMYGSADQSGAVDCRCLQ